MASSCPGFALTAAALLGACASGGPRGARPETAAAAHPRSVEIALVQERDYGLIPVSVADKGPLWFVLDTAASSSVISPATRDLLGLGGKGVQADVTGASGKTAYEAVELPALSVGGFTAEKVGVVVVDLKRFEAPVSGRTFAGILGNDVLRRFDFVLDIPRGVLRLQPRGPEAPSLVTPAMRCVPNLAEDEGWVVVDVRVGEAPVRAIIDTGAGRSVYNWAAARAAGVSTATPGVVRAARNASGLGSGSTETWLYTFPSVQAGSARFTPAESRIADLPVFAALGLGDRPAVIFGTNYLRDRRMTVSYSSDQVCFDERPSARSTSNTP